jgi:hypothetical protein
VRAVKTIRMSGELDLFSRSCARERTEGNYSCILIQMVRHPLSTLKSERSSARLPQARGVKNPTVVAPGGMAAWIDSRAGNMSSFCAPLLKDVQFALMLQRRRKRLERKGVSVNHLPRVMLLKYDELIRTPLEVANRTHALLDVYTSRPKLTAFVQSHLDSNYTVVRDLPTSAPVVSMKNVTGGKVVVHKLRKRLKTEFGTVRPPRKCDTLEPMEKWPECAELLRLLHPVYMC